VLFKLKTLDKFESVSGLHMTAVRQLILMFVAFYALILDLFAPPRCSILHLIGVPVSLLGGGRPTRGTGNSNTAYDSPIEATECRAAPSKLLNVATRHKEALTGQKMSSCCPTFSGLWRPPFVGPMQGLQSAFSCLNPPLLVYR